jgi:PAS domain S-box-containing protein
VLAEPAFGRHGREVRKPIVLAVDDTPANLIAVEAVLDREFTLRFARSGKEAIAMLADNPDVDVILMDVQMPVMDGFETAKLIKDLPNCGSIPIVFITAVYKEDPFVRRGYEVGGLDYFTKPFDPDLLRLKMSVYASFRQKAAVLEERERQIRETEELMQAGRKLSLVLESLPVGVLIADQQGHIFQANDEVSRIFKSTELIENDAYGEILGWWDSKGHVIKDEAGAVARALRTGESSHNELLQIRCFDGVTRTLRTSASPLLGLAGEIVGAVIVIKDLTEPKRLEQELESRVARLVSLGVELEQSLRPS